MVDTMTLHMGTRRLQGTAEGSAFSPVTSWYRIDDLKFARAKVELENFSGPGSVAGAVEVTASPKDAPQVERVSRFVRKESHYLNLRGQRLERAGPIYLRAGWLTKGEVETTAQGNLTLRHSGVARQIRQDAIARSLRPDGSVDQAAAAEMLALFFPAVGDQRGTAQFFGGDIGSTLCAVEACDPHNCSDQQYVIGGDPGCSTEGVCENDDCTIVICKDGYECSGGNTCGVLGCDDAFDYIPVCDEAMFDVPDPICWLDLVPGPGCLIETQPACSPIHVTSCEGLNNPCGVLVNCDAVTGGPCNGGFVSSPVQQKGQINYALIAQMFRFKRQGG